MPFALKALAKAGLVIGAILTLIGLLARWFPALDIVNNGLPFLLVGTLIVAILAALARSGLLTVLALLLPSSTAPISRSRSKAARKRQRKEPRVFSESSPSMSGITTTGSTTSPSFFPTPMPILS